MKMANAATSNGGRKVNRKPKRALKTILREIETEGKKIVDYNKMTFADLADFYEQKYLHDAVYINRQKISGLRDAYSARLHLNNSRRFFGRKRLREITYYDIQAYQAERLKTPTIHKRQRTISATDASGLRFKASF